MKTFTLVSLTLFSCLTLVGQDCIPKFPGGDNALLEFIKTNTKYPDSAKIKGIEGRVIIRFDIDSSGKILNPVIIKPVEKLLDNEVLRVVRLMPSFVPCKLMFGNKNFPYSLPFTFKLNN